MRPDRLFWKNRKVLITGHTGFKGGWLSLWLHRLGAEVFGISLPPTTRPNLYSLAAIADCLDSRFTDICDASKLAGCVQQAAPEIVLHLAAQPLVRSSYRTPLETFQTNIMGTANLLESLRSLNSVKTVIVITTDKVYRNQEWLFPYRETDPLGGHDPYSASKAATEIVTASYRDAFLAEQGVAVATARAGNVIGGGDWSEDRLIPDAIRAWQSGKPLVIRNPQAIRPWQHVLEPLLGYLLLAEHLWENQHLAGAYNFGPETHSAATVRSVVEQACQFSGYENNMVRWEDSNDGPHEAGWLALEIAKSSNILGFSPRWSLPETIERTVTWYRRLHQGDNARTLCNAEIDAFEDIH